MSQPINLNKARKAKARTEKRAKADANAVAFGRSKAEKAADRAARERGETLYYERIHKIIGQGNFVVVLAHQVWNSIDYCAMDIFRLEGGLIVEHWDNVEVIPTPEVARNSGKF